MQRVTSARGGQADRGEADRASRPSPRALLATKLHVPAPRQRLISRTGLAEALSAGHDRKLTLQFSFLNEYGEILFEKWVD